MAIINTHLRKKDSSSCWCSNEKQTCRKRLFGCLCVDICIYKCNVLLVKYIKIKKNMCIMFMKRECLCGLTENKTKTKSWPHYKLHFVSLETRFSRNVNIRQALSIQTDTDANEVTSNRWFCRNLENNAYSRKLLEQLK